MQFSLAISILALLSSASPVSSTGNPTVDSSYAAVFDATAALVNDTLFQQLVTDSNKWETIRTANMVPLKLDPSFIKLQPLWKALASSDQDSIAGIQAQISPLKALVDQTPAMKKFKADMEVNCGMITRDEVALHTAYDDLYSRYQIAEATYIGDAIAAKITPEFSSLNAFCVEWDTYVEA